MIDISGFCDYLAYYPDSDEAGFDGVHAGGWNGLRADAPREAVEAYAHYRHDEERARQAGVKL